jgi:hypothetical protein
MAGIKSGRVDYSEKSPNPSDKRTGTDPQPSDVPAPIRAGVPVGGSQNENTIEKSAATKTTRPNSGK